MALLFTTPGYRDFRTFARQRYRRRRAKAGCASGNEDNPVLEIAHTLSPSALF